MNQFIADAVREWFKCFVKNFHHHESQLFQLDPDDESHQAVIAYEDEVLRELEQRLIEFEDVEMKAVDEEEVSHHLESALKGLWDEMEDGSTRFGMSLPNLPWNHSLQIDWTQQTVELYKSFLNRVRDSNLQGFLNFPVTKNQTCIQGTELEGEISQEKLNASQSLVGQACHEFVCVFFCAFG